MEEVFRDLGREVGGVRMGVGGVTHSGSQEYTHNIS